MEQIHLHMNVQHNYLMNNKKMFIILKEVLVNVLMIVIVDQNTGVIVVGMELIMVQDIVHH